MRKQKMGYVWRISKYVFPQWPRIIVIFIAILVSSLLLSLSFVSIVPMLKVMMGQEGLHGYVDRKITSDRYGLKFYMPDQAEILDPNNAEVERYLLVTNVRKKSAAETAGLKPQDYIVGAGDYLITKSEEKIPTLGLLQDLATAPGNQPIKIHYRRVDVNGDPQFYNTTLNVKDEPFYLGGVQKLMSYVPVMPTKENKLQAIKVIIFVLVIFTIVRCIATFFQKYLANKVTFIAITNLRKDMFSRILNMPVSFFDIRNSSDSVSRINRDAHMLSVGVSMVLGKAIREPVQALSLLGFAMLMNFKLTLIFLISAPLIMGTVVWLGKRIRKATKKSLMSSGIMLGKLSEAFSSVKVIKVYNQQEYERKKFENIIHRLLKQLLRISKADSATGPIMEVLGMIAGSAALLFGLHWVLAGGMDESEFFGLLLLLGAAAESVRKSSDIWNNIQQSNAAAERIFGLLEEPVEAEKPDGRILKTVNGRIEFRNVVFSYPTSTKPVLNGVNLTVEAGHNIAIVGPNGSGKTTLVNLIPRFYDVDSGTVLIDGVDVRDLKLHNLREHIGLVTQNIVTFNDTVAANIGYGKNGATMDEIITAAEKAKAHEFIEQLPTGYEAKIGEHGTGLSGGQLQRIVIARAILKDPAILIFDEATSQVDAESEAKIHNAIEEIMSRRTTIIIAHRFSTVISADIIVVMDKGRIVAQGKHDELIRGCTLYQNLYETQLVKA
ncbi:MAG: ABC transporter transmembrane domain-containing protein [Phycisphaerae bacterium]|jgi:ABC-type multidrug transport system fused ATPase/permease subunit